MRFQVDGVDPHGQVVRWPDPVLGPLVGDELEYGALFVYLLWRFWVSGTRWMPVGWRDTSSQTPCADMFNTEPRLSGTVATEVFGFHARKAEWLPQPIRDCAFPLATEDWDGADP